MKIECIGLKLTTDKVRDEEALRDAGWPKEEAGRPTMVVARGLLRHTWSLVNFLPYFVNFPIKFYFVMTVCLPHMGFPIQTFYTTCGDKHISKNRDRE
jgi:hypothetical protein